MTFKCERADLRAPIRISGLHRQPLVMEVAAAAAEFAAWHALNIFPQLNDFRGYDTLTFEVDD